MWARIMLRVEQASFDRLVKHLDRLVKHVSSHIVIPHFPLFILFQVDFQAEQSYLKVLMMSLHRKSLFFYFVSY